MQNEYEIISHRKIQHINIFLNRITYRSFHLHNDFELLCVLNGKATITTVKKKYEAEKGNIIILNSSESHEIDAHGESITVLIIQISNHFLREYYPKIRNIVFAEGSVDSYLTDEEKKKFISLIEKSAYTYLKADERFELECVSYLSLIISMLLKNIPCEALSEKIYAQKKKQSKRIDRIFSYINSNYQTPIKLQDVADIEKLTPTHLSHIFTENFGVTFQEYLNNIRFEHAVRIMGNNNLSLSEIAEISGFSELKYMTRMFEKHLGIKPKEFRVRIEKNEDSKNRTSENILEYIFSDKEGLEYLENCIEC